MADVRAMCAIGMRGQLGLNGRLPWEGNKGREYVADVARFFDVTRGHVIIAGPRTVASIPAFAYEERTICEIRSENHPADVLAWFPDRVVYVGGGPPVWETYAPFIRHWDITRLPYDGEADRWFDPAWLVEDTLEIPVQVNGKLRDVIKVSATAAQQDIEKAALQAEKVKPFLEGKTVKKIIIVPKRLINIVVG